jgi:hypothetical protein
LALGTLIVVSTFLPLPASASPDPGGNNGTIKVDGGDLQGNDNNPHVGCGFNIEWFGFDEGTQTSTVTFEGQAPTGGGTLLTDTFDFQGGGSGGQLDASKSYDLSAALQSITPQANQGWHVTLTVETTGSQGNDSKHKTFWVSGCAGPTVNAHACSGQGGTEGITLSITNNDVDQTFTVDQDGTVSSEQIASGGTATVELPQPATDSTIHVTSGANPNLTVTTVVPALACQEVLSPVVGSITLDKVLAGDGAPQDDPTFTFAVACDDASATVTSPVSIKASDAAQTVASGVAVGTSCTVTETNAHGASGTSFAVNGGAPTMGDHIVVTPADGSTAAVVATNTFEPSVLDTVITRDHPSDPAAPQTVVTDPQTVVGDQTVDGTALARTGFDARLFLVVGTSLILAGLVLLRTGSLSKTLND